MIRLYDLQIVNGEMYRSQAEKRLIRTADSYAPRGNIYDRNGVLLATSEIKYNLSIYRTKRTTEELNKLLLKIVDILKNHGDKPYSTFPIDLNTMEYTKKEEDIARLKKDYGIDEDATLVDVVNFFIDKYMLQDFDEMDQKKILPLRYETSNSGYTSYRATVIAKNISKESMHELKENYMELGGIYIDETSERKYLQGNTLSHVIGYVGKISQNEYEEKKELGYLRNDMIGKSGIESTFEGFLRGINGSKRLEMDSLRKNHFRGRTFKK